MRSILLSGLRDQNNGKKIGISGPRTYYVTTLESSGLLSLLIPKVTGAATLGTLRYFQNCDSNMSKKLRGRY